MKFPPFKVWPQVALVWDPSFRKAEVINQMGFFSISLGPLAIEIDGRPYVRWMTDVVLPEARMMASWPVADGVTHIDHLEVEAPSTSDSIYPKYIHSPACPCQNKLA